MIKTDSLVLLIYLLIIGLFYVDVISFDSMASNDKMIKMWKNAVVT
jgi:hypothetical protein